MGQSFDNLLGSMMFFNPTRSLESICGVEISDDEYDPKADDEKHFIVEEVSRTTNTVAKKKKRSRFDIGTPTKVLQKKSKDDTAILIKHPDSFKKKSPRIVLKKRGRPAKSKDNFFERIYPCTKCKRKFTTERNFKEHM